MRIINIIELNGGVVENVESFAVLDEQLVDEVVEEAEKFFSDKVKAKRQKAGDPDEEIENEMSDFLEDGYWETEFMEYYSITIFWSTVENVQI